jgi:Cof subfamily protein (haloacid dehalogenase superfamily)
MHIPIFDGILLVSDMDGTLLDSKSQVSRENQVALEYFVNHGGLFTIATGRMERTLHKYLPVLPINVPGVLYNGAVIYDFTAQKKIWEICLAKEIGPVIRDLITRFPGLGIEAFQGGEVFFLQQNHETEKHIAREGLSPQITLIDQVPLPWIKVILAWEPEKLPAVETYLAAYRRFFRTVYSEPQFLEILPQAASKGHAVQKLVQLIGREDLKVVAMGDNLNDLEMIKMADLGIAVANAHPGLKKAARFNYGHHDAHAVAEVVEHLKNKII